MRVTTVQVERRKSDNSYGNRMVMLSAELDEGDDVAAVVDDLAALASERIERAEQADAQKAELVRQKKRAQYRAQQEEARRRTWADVPAEAVTGDDLAAEEEDDQGEPEPDDDDADALGAMKRGEPVRWRPEG